MNGQRVILAGGTGFIGTALSRKLQEQGAEIVILSRNSSPARGRVTQLQWDGRTLGDWAGSVDGALAVVNLTGRSVNCRHNAENLREIIESRVNAVEVLAKAIARSAKPPKVFVQAAGQGIYGDFGDGCCDEGSLPGEGFLVRICQLWEAAFNESPMPDTRRVLFRIGFVLGAGGGGLPLLRKLTKWGFGGTAGSGRQSVNWIHESDLSNAFTAAIRNEEFAGVFNACGPSPVTNSLFMRELRHVLHRPWSPPAPAWAVRAVAWLMNSDGRLALTGRRCTPGRLLEHGFKFSFPELRHALVDLCEEGRHGMPG